jgi:hypothetical protein
MKLKIFASAMLLFALSFNCFGQGYRNTFFAEILGSGYLYSINYEREFKNQFVGRIGFSTFESDFVVPFTLGKFFGKKSHHFEISAGFDFVNYHSSDEGRDNGIALTGFLGYRFQKPDNRFQFRAGFTPIYVPNDVLGIQFIPSGGISFGYRF